MDMETTPQTTASSKTCTKCGETKPIGEYHRRAASKDGRKSRCRACSTADNAAYQKANPDKVRAKSNRWAAANREKKREIYKRWYDNNRAARAEYNRVYREENSEYFRQKEQDRRAANSSRVSRILKMAEHFKGRDGMLDKLARAVANRSDAHGLCWLSRDIDELLLIHFYKDEI